jgi:hypothetical protein
MAGALHPESRCVHGQATHVGRRALKRVCLGFCGGDITGGHVFPQAADLSWRVVQEASDDATDQVLVAHQSRDQSSTIEHRRVRHRITGTDRNSFGRACRRRRDPPPDGCRDVLQIDRLGDIVVHARRQASLAIAFERVGGHRDDGHPVIPDV